MTCLDIELNLSVKWARMNPWQLTRKLDQRNDHFQVLRVLVQERRLRRWRHPLLHLQEQRDLGDEHGRLVTLTIQINSKVLKGSQCKFIQKTSTPRKNNFKKILLVWAVVVAQQLSPHHITKKSWIRNPPGAGIFFVFFYRYGNVSLYFFSMEMHQCLFFQIENGRLAVQLETKKSFLCT